jgi:hypothetical protein
MFPKYKLNRKEIQTKIEELIKSTGLIIELINDAYLLYVIYNNSRHRLKVFI